jgi:hypothetical protein
VKVGWQKPSLAFLDRSTDHQPFREIGVISWFIHPMNYRYYRYRYRPSTIVKLELCEPQLRVNSSLGHHRNLINFPKILVGGDPPNFQRWQVQKKDGSVLANSSGSENFRSLNMMCKQMAIFYRGNDHEPSDLGPKWGYHIFTNPMESFSHGQEWHFHTFSKPCFFSSQFSMPNLDDCDVGPFVMMATNNF